VGAAAQLDLTMTDDLDGLTQFATVRQLEYLEALRAAGGNQRAAARSIGVADTTIMRAVDALRAKAAAARGPLMHGVPDGFKLRGVSALLGADGELKQRWVCTEPDRERQAELLRAALAALVEDVRGLGPVTPAPAPATSDRLLAVYPIGDPHFGMLAQAEESGADFDLAEARRVTLAAVDRLVQVSPATHTAILLPLGDVLHCNDQTNVTPAHKHQLDTSARFIETVKVAIATFKHAIQRLVAKHERVIVRFVRGNHDPEAVWALALAIANFFEADPRVEVDLSPADHWFYRHGQVLLGACHGDRARAEQLPGVMACDRARDWGETRHRHWLCGHVHHSSVKEFPGVTVETFRTLAAADAYAAGHGYRAGRDMRCIVYDREHGEVERYRCDIGQL
jgi:hypothetical protein